MTLLPHRRQSSSIVSSLLLVQNGRKASLTSFGHPCLVYFSTLLSRTSVRVARRRCERVTGRLSICDLLNSRGLDDRPYAPTSSNGRRESPSALRRSKLDLICVRR